MMRLPSTCGHCRFEMGAGGWSWCIDCGRPRGYQSAENAAWHDRELLRTGRQVDGVMILRWWPGRAILASDVAPSEPAPLPSPPAPVNLSAKWIGLVARVPWLFNVCYNLFDWGNRPHWTAEEIRLAKTES